MNRFPTLMLGVLAMLPVALPCGADEAADRGLAIALEADRRDEGFGDSQATMRMTLRNSRGDERTRQMTSRTLEVPTGGDKNLIVFEDPADVKGTALLTYTYTDQPDDQWLYLPALKRVKRISSNNKSGPFVGSEFAYEDLAGQEVEKYTYRYLRDESIDDREHFVVERYPVDNNSGYTRQIAWIGKSEYRTWKVEFYDRKKSLLKTLTFGDYERYLERFWRPRQLDMVNHQSGKSTTLTFADYRFGNGFSEQDFSQNSLRKAR